MRETLPIIDDHREEMLQHQGGQKITEAVKKEICPQGHITGRAVLPLLNIAFSLFSFYFLLYAMARNR